MPGGRVQQGDDLGQAIAWTGLVEGTPVYDPDGRRIGVVEWVEAPMDIFEGVVIHTRPLPGRHRFARHDQIAELRERGVVLSVGADEREDADQRSRPPARPRAPEPTWEARLRRAWDRLTGRR